MHDTAHTEPGTARIAGSPTMVLAPSEAVVVLHLRGALHMGDACAMCRTEGHLTEQLLRAQAHARTEEQRRIRTQIDNAYLSREVLRLTHTVDSIITG